MRSVRPCRCSCAGCRGAAPPPPGLTVPWCGMPGGRPPGIPRLWPVGWAGSGAGSNSAENRSRAAAPSATTWWRRRSTPTLPSSRPVMTHISQGLLIGSRAGPLRSQHSRSRAASSPGLGTAALRTRDATSNPTSGTHTGEPCHHRVGSSTSRRRGSRATRLATCRRMASRSTAADDAAVSVVRVQQHQRRHRHGQSPALDAQVAGIERADPPQRRTTGGGRRHAASVRAPPTSGQGPKPPDPAWAGPRARERPSARWPGNRVAAVERHGHPFDRA